MKLRIPRELMRLLLMTKNVILLTQASKAQAKNLFWFPRYDFSKAFKTNRAKQKYGYTKIVILVAIIETLHFSVVNKEAMQNKKNSIPIRKRSIGMTYIGTVLIVTKYIVIINS